MNVIGMVIEIPVWNMTAMVIDQIAPLHGDTAIVVKLQEHPDQDSEKCSWYRLDDTVKYEVN